MKKLMRALSLVLVTVMVLGLFGIVANAAPQEKGTLTIDNASEGETYEIYLLFEAVLSDKQDGPVMYTGEIPSALAPYFTKNDQGYITAVQANELSSAVIADMVKYVSQPDVEPTASKKAEGDVLVFEDLTFGYYIVKSSLGAVISVDTTNPNAIIKDKNSDEWEIRKRINDQDVSIGDIVEYELNVRTQNWFGEKSVTKYTVEDTLPAFLTDLNVTEIKVQKDGVVQYDAATAGDPLEFDNNKTITFPWVGEDGKHLYENDSVIIIKYTAKVTPAAVIAGAGNKNTMTAKVYVDNSDESYEEKTDNAIFYSYGTVVHKTDNKTNGLPGATFAANGLIVKNIDNIPGYYQVISYDPNSSTTGTEMTTDDQGILVIEGLCSDKPLTFVELIAPDGYNKLTAPVAVTVYKLSVEFETSYEKIWYDADGNVIQTEEGSSSSGYVLSYPEEFNAQMLGSNTIVNKAGVELPETGGMGTTMFILFGSMIALAAAVVLVARKKAAGYR